MVTDFPGTKFELTMFAPDSPKPWHHTYTSVTRTWAWAWLMFFDQHRDYGSDLRGEGPHSFDGSKEPANDVQVSVFQEAEMPWVEAVPGPSCGFTETAAGCAQLVGRDIRQVLPPQISL